MILVDIGLEAKETQKNENVETTISVVETSSESTITIIDDCDETFYEDTQILSPNYPLPYPKEYNRVWCLKMAQGRGLEVVIDELDIDAKSDFLLIEGVSDAKSKQFVTGNKEVKLKFINTNEASIKFIANHNNEHQFKGFKIQVSSTGKIDSTTDISTTSTTSSYAGQYATIVKEIIMSKELQGNTSTFDSVIRSILVESTNEWLVAHNLDEQMEPCKSENVIIDKIFPCPQSWPNNDQCIRMEFAIPLNESDYESLTRPPSDIQINTEYELTEQNLEKMWNEFGANKMQVAGFEEYKLPNSTNILLVWTLISVCIIAAFIVVLYSIWKYDFFRDYRR